jgi:hypothetical protein
MYTAPPLSSRSMDTPFFFAFVSLFDTDSSHPSVLHSTTSRSTTSAGLRPARANPPRYATASVLACSLLACLHTHE